MIIILRKTIVFPRAPHYHTRIQIFGFRVLSRSLKSSINLVKGNSNNYLSQDHKTYKLTSPRVLRSEKTFGVDAWPLSYWQLTLELPLASKKLLSPQFDFLHAKYREHSTVHSSSEPVSPETISLYTMALTPDDEEIASQYRKMLKMGLPEGAVMQKMAIGDVPQNIQDAVLSGDDTLPNNTNGGGHVGDEENKTDNPIRDGSDGSGSDPPTNTDAMSEREYLEEEEEEEIEVDYEEEIIEDDDLMEEEVIDDESDDDDDDDDDEFEEEILEEIVEEDVEIQYAPNYQIAPDNQTRQTEEDITESTHTRKMNNNAPIQQQPRREQVEYQQQLRREQVEYQQEQLRRQQPPPNKILVKREPEKPLPSPSACWYWILCIILLGLIGAAAGGGYWLTTRDGDNVSTIQPPNRTTPPTAAPSVGVSTSFNDVQGGECNFDDVSNPNPIDQCICFGEIAIIETDIRERYRYNLESFVETYYENYDDDISSCSPRNQALVWISSGDDAELTTTQRIQRFALATIFASLGGTQWNNSENWLIYDDSCTWFGVACSEGVATELVLDGNNLVGMVSISMLSIIEFVHVTMECHLTYSLLCFHPFSFHLK
jgi:hypothetical protein